jgi:hypothetical protein
VAQGGDLTVLLEGIRARKQRRRALQEELAGLEGLRPVSARDLQDIQRDVEGRLTDWRGLLRRQLVQSRQILRRLLVGRIVFRLREDGVYKFSSQRRAWLQGATHGGGTLLDFDISAIAAMG